MAGSDSETLYQTVDDYMTWFSSQKDCKLKILYVNARSLRNKLDSILILKKVGEPDLICITESWLKDEDLNFYNIPGYNLYHAI